MPVLGSRLARSKGKPSEALGATSGPDMVSITTDRAADQLALAILPCPEEL